MPDRFNVITGGPGSGKTSLIEALAADGVKTMPEAGRAIIRDQVEIGGPALPWADAEGFASLMLGWELRSYREAEALPGPVMFDRALPDIIGFLRHSGKAAPAYLARAAAVRRYNKRVFIAPPWPEIFTRDRERRQSLAEAEATYRAMVGAYTELGYELLPLPFAPVTERAAFVRAHMRALTPLPDRDTR